MNEGGHLQTLQEEIMLSFCLRIFLYMLDPVSAVSIGVYKRVVFNPRRDPDSGVCSEEAFGESLSALTSSFVLRVSKLKRVSGGSKQVLDVMTGLGLTHLEEVLTISLLEK